VQQELVAALYAHVPVGVGSEGEIALDAQETTAMLKRERHCRDGGFSRQSPPEPPASRHRNEPSLFRSRRLIALTMEGPMAQSGADAEKDRTFATRDDVKDVFGSVDDGKMMAILALRPTILDVEEASMWLSGDQDVFGPGHPLKDIAGRIVAVITADEEE
jgi:hypothetical protein